jgi:adenosylmethionine-8-amino-7-oxononanoate aminotransferase
MTLAKGITSGYLPLSAVMVGKRVSEMFWEKGGEFAHGFTYSGHPVPCAVALENIAIIEEENLVERVREDVGPYFQQQLATLAEHPLVGEARGIGLLGAVELVADKATKAPFDPVGKVGAFFAAQAQAHGVIFRNLGDTIACCPPMIISEAEIDEVLAAFETALNETAAWVAEQGLAQVA